MTNSVLLSLVSRVVNTVTGFKAAIAGPSEETLFDPYEASPINRETLTKIFKTEPSSPWSVDTGMRESERHELHSMSLIRNALYAQD